MKNELLDLEHLIKVVLNPAKLTVKNLHENFLIQNKQFAELEMERIQQRFQTVSVVPGNQGCLDIYFRQHQAALVLLSNIVFGYLDASDPRSIQLLSNDAEVLEFYEAVAAVAEKLLTFMEQAFPNHLDGGLAISKARRVKERKGITHCLKRIRKEVKGSTIHDELLAILCAPFESFLLPEKTISYSELYYLEAFRKGIHAFFALNKIQSSEQLCSLLIFLNHNSLRLLNYLSLMHGEAAKRYQHIPDLILYYHLQLKQINQQPVKPGIVFKPALPSMKDQISNWLYDEIHYCEKQWQIQCNHHASSKATTEKLNTSLSVAELAFLMKLLQQAKVIRSDNSTELMNFLAIHVRTERIESISPGSLRNKYYNVERSTVDSMKIVIKDLMRLTMEY